MNAPTPIADMITEMLKNCIPMETIIMAVRAMERALSTGVHRSTVDLAAEKRRAWDRERKRAERSQQYRLSDDEWYPLVHEIIKRDGGACTYCGTTTEKLTADHVVPLARGGTNDRSNLTACCIPCNVKKGKKLISEWPLGASAKFHPSIRTCPPDTGNSSLFIREEKSQQFKEVKKERKNAGSKLPPDWRPNEKHYTEGASRGMSRRDVDERAQAMRDWCEANANRAITTKANWDAAFMGAWLKQGNRNGASNGKTRQGSLLDSVKRELADLEREDEADPPVYPGHIQRLPR